MTDEVAQPCCGGGCGCQPTQPHGADPDAGWSLPDMSGVSITYLMANGSPALSRSVQRLVEQLDDPNAVISAFTSFVE